MTKKSTPSVEYHLEFDGEETIGDLLYKKHLERMEPRDRRAANEPIPHSPAHQPSCEDEAGLLWHHHGADISESFESETDTGPAQGPLT